MNNNRDVILDYNRAATTGPMLPLVLSPTTFGEQLSVGVTYRIAGFSQAKIETVMDLFLRQIEHLSKASLGRRAGRIAPVLPAAAAMARFQQPAVL